MMDLSQPSVPDDAEHLARLRRELELRAAPPPPPEPPPAPAGTTGAPRKGLWASITAAGAVVLAKLKFLLVGLKFLKLGKLLLTTLTMALSIWVYAKFFGLPFAFGFVVLILLHELGHAAAMRLEGIASGAPVFIPFFGAVIALKDRPLDARQEAVIALGGPLAGAAASFLLAGVGWLLRSDLLMALAYTGCFMNLFNLLPVPPLDGGRVAAAISRWLWVLGLAVAIPLAVMWRHPFLIYFIILGAIRLVTHWRQPDEAQAYYRIAPAARAAFTGLYFGLAGALAVGAMLLHGHLPRG